MLKTEIVNYKEYGKCLSVTNGVINLVATLDMGPKIVRYGYVNGVNIINDNKAAFPASTNEEFQKYYGKGTEYSTYAGHRLWIAPEYYPETYYPDTNPVEYKINGNEITFIQAPQKENNIQLKMIITVDDDDTNVTVKHEITNIGNRTKEFALWALTVAAKGGIEIIPMNTHDTGLLPNRKIGLWPYTDPRDESIYFGKDYTTIKQPTDGPLKLSFDLKAGTVYYVVEDTVFIKRYYPNFPHGNYVDGGFSYETYSCEEFTELETLSELKKYEPGETGELIEQWSLCKKEKDFCRKDDNSISEFIKTL